MVTLPYTHSFMIVQDDISVITPGGAFNGCVKIKWAEIIGAFSETSTEIWGPIIGRVCEWYAGINEDAGVIETWADFYLLMSYVP